MKIETNQELFFDKNASAKKNINRDRSSFFYMYTKKDLYSAAEWLSNKRSVLDYGCGLGEVLEIYLSAKLNKKNKIIGIDLSQNCIDIMKNRYPKYIFERVADNKLNFIQDNSVESAYIAHVLHHSNEHSKILNEIFRVLTNEGKFYLTDITSNNFFLEFGRKAFIHMPKSIKKKFSGDLFVDNSIPEKLEVDVDKTIELLKTIGFKIRQVKYMHLFLFLFEWLEIIGFKGGDSLKNIYKFLLKAEECMLKKSLFQKRATLFSIYAEK